MPFALAILIFFYDPSALFADPSDPDCGPAEEAMVLEAKKGPQKKKKPSDEEGAPKTDEKTPADIRKKMGIVSLEPEEQKSFQSKMEKLLRRLYPDHDFSKHPIRFEIFDSPQANAFFAKDGDESIIAFSAGLLKTAKTQDLLAFVLAHEYGHYLIRQEHGDLVNSKLEEGTADVTAIRAVEKAEMDASVALDFFPIDSNRDDFITTAFENLADPHPDNVNRRNVVEATLAHLSLERGGMNRTKGIKRRANNPELVDLGKKYEKKAKKASSEKVTASFDELSEKGLTRSLQRRITLLDEAVQSNDKKEIKAQAKKITGLLSKLYSYSQLNSLDNKSTRDTVESAIDALFKHHDTIWPPNETQTEFATAYRNASLTYHSLSRNDYQELPLVGMVMQGLQDKMTAFAESKSKREAGKRAVLLIAELEKLDHALHDLNKAHPPLTPVFKAFSIAQTEKDMSAAKVKGEVVPWNSLVGWAKQDKSGQLTRALLYLGVHDSRLFSDLSSTDLLSLSTLNWVATSTGAKRYQSETRPAVYALEVSPEGKIKEYFNTEATGHLGHQKALMWAAREAILREAPDAMRKAIAAGPAGKKDFETYVGMVEDAGLDVMIGLEHLVDHPDVFFSINGVGIFSNNSKTNRPDDVAEAYSKIFQHLEAVADQEPGKRKQIRKVVTNNLAWQRLDGARRDALAYLIHDPHRIFSQEDKLSFLTSSYPEKLFGENQLAETSTLRLMGWKKAESWQELKSQLDELTKFGVQIQQRDEIGLTPVTDLMKATLISGYLTFKSTSPDDDLPLQDLLGHLTPNIKETHPKLHATLVEKVKRRKNWPDDAKGLYDMASLLSKLDLYPKDSHLEDRLLSNALAKVDEIKKPEARRALAEDLLTSKAAEWPYVREDMEKAWTRAVLDVAEKSPDRDATILAQARKFASQLNYHSRYNLMERLAEESVAQRELSLALGKMVNEVSKETYEESQRMGAAAEAMADLARRDVTFRHDLLHFLLGRGDAAEQEKVGSSMERALRVQEIPTKNERLAKELSKWADLSPQARKRRLEVIYEQFWDAPLAGRAVVIKSLLFSDNPNLKVRQQIAENNAMWALDRLFPEGSEYSEESRKVLLAYFKTLDEEIEMPYFVAAALGAANQFKHDRNATIGKRLAKMLEMMGPAEIKLGQAIHSFDQTPDDIRLGMKMMKTEVDVPPRWDLAEHYEKTVPEDLRGRIDSIGKRLGAASYYYVYEVKMKDGTTRALALLKPNARARSERGLERMSQLVTDLSGDPQLGQLTPALKELVEQTKAMASIETDPKLSAQQSKLARELYENKNISVNGKTYHFNPARTLELGNGYRLMEKAEGIHFNEMPTKTPEQKQAKKDFGLAYHTLELGHLLSGKPFDEDRHGGQMRIVGDNATLFDFGALKLTPPDPAELRAFGEILKNLNDTLESKGIGETNFSKLFVDKMNQYRASGQPDTGYLVSVHKAWLALSDYRIDLTKQDYQNMLMAVMTRGSGAIHPEIMNGYMEKMSFAEKVKLMGQAMMQKASPIKFE